MSDQACSHKLLPWLGHQPLNQVEKQGQLTLQGRRLGTGLRGGWLLHRAREQNLLEVLQVCSVCVRARACAEWDCTALGLAAAFWC